MTDIYHILDDGRILELEKGQAINRDAAIWARNLSTNEKETYLTLKCLGYSDLYIYSCLNQDVKKA